MILVTFCGQKLKAHPPTLIAPFSAHLILPSHHPHWIIKATSVIIVILLALFFCHARKKYFLLSKNHAFVHYQWQWKPFICVIEVICLVCQYYSTPFWHLLLATTGSTFEWNVLSRLEFDNLCYNSWYLLFCSSQLMNDLLENV